LQFVRQPTGRPRLPQEREELDDVPVVVDRVVAVEVEQLPGQQVTFLVAPLVELPAQQRIHVSAAVPDVGHPQHVVDADGAEAQFLARNTKHLRHVLLRPLRAVAEAEHAHPRVLVDRPADGHHRVGVVEQDGVGAEPVHRLRNLDV